MKNKLTISAENKYTDPADMSSIKRSNVRGLEILLSEKSYENEIKENQSLKSKRVESDDNKTLKYGTEAEERSERSASRKSIISSKDEMYGQLEKLMTNVFKDGQKEEQIDAQDYKTLKYAETEDNNGDSNNENISPLSSSSSSPTTAKRVIATPQSQDALDKIHEVADPSSANSYSRGQESLVTPRDTVKNFNSEQSSGTLLSGGGINENSNNAHTYINSNASPQELSYRTPTTKNADKEHAEIYAQKEITQATLKANFALGRREDTFSNQFYSNDQMESFKDITYRSEGNDKNIRIYVDQFEGDNDIDTHNTSKIHSPNQFNSKLPLKQCQ
jgi:hypothetical protein